MLTRTGVPTEDDLRDVVPSQARLARRRVAVVECFQEIPCDPCADACPFGAIEAFANINDRPRVLSDECVGCALCVAKCPGLAIFMVDLTGDDGRAVVTIPYEFLPLPRPGDVVAALDRAGEVVAEVRVVMVQDAALQDRTMAVWLDVPRELAMAVRAIRVPARAAVGGVPHAEASALGDRPAEPGEGE